MSKPRLYDDNLVSSWPVARIHPNYYERIGELALLHGRTFNNELQLLLGTLLDAIETNGSTDA